MIIALEESAMLDEDFRSLKSAVSSREMRKKNNEDTLNSLKKFFRKSIEILWKIGTH